MALDSTVALDNLAANGVLNYDATAFINGTKPRYVGNPYGYIGNPLDMPLGYGNLPNYGIIGGTYLSGAPARGDILINSKGRKNNSDEHSKGPFSFSKENLPWAKIATGGFAAGIVLMVGHKIKSFFRPKDVAKAGKAAKAAENEGKGFFAKAKDTVASWFSSDKVKEGAKKTKKVATEAKDKVKTAAKKAKDGVKTGKLESIKNRASELFHTGLEKFKNMKKGPKIALLSAAGVLGLYELYRAATSKKTQYPPQGY